jgi:hypothetical protein
MKTFKQFVSEDLIDDILASIGDPKKTPNIEKIFVNDKKAIPRSRTRMYKPRVVKANAPDNFKEYLRSDGEVYKELGKPLTLAAIIDAYAHRNIALSDSLIFDFDVSEVNKYREYDRSFKDPGKRNAEEMLELAADIQKHGIKEASILHLRRLKNGNVTVILGEGNHRLSVARKFKIKTMPVRFSY